MGHNGTHERKRAWLRVLVIESCPSTREVMADLLDALGYHATVVPDASAALRLKELPEAILAELDPPDGAALDALWNLRCQAGWGDVPAIGLTFGDPSTEALAAARAGFFRVLRKPILVQELNELLRGIRISRVEVAA